MVSTAALTLHTYGVIAGIEAGRAGFVPDDYLSAITVETSVAALELMLAGVWHREPGGYRVDAAETMRIAREVRRQLTDMGSFRPGH